MAKPKRQSALPGMERKGIKECDHAAEAYCEARDARMALTEKEVEARDALVRVMRKHELTVYRDEEAEPPLIVTLVPGEDRVKVSRAKDGEEEERPRRRRRSEPESEEAADA